MKTGSAALSIALIALGLAGFASAQPEYGERHRPARDLVARVQSDLQRAAQSPTVRGKDRERYDNALRHLSQFDRDLTRGKFDKGKLDTAIDNVKRVVQNNTLVVEDRDALREDLARLRGLRAAYDRRRE